MNKSIAFCGASGTGKSTLAFKLASVYNVGYCPVGARSVAKEAFDLDNPYDIDVLGLRGKFQVELFKKKSAWENENAHNFITDRTHLDNLAYTLMHSADVLSIDLINQMIEQTKKYDYIFFLPVETFHDLGGDPSRLKDMNYHYVYQFILKNMMTTYNFGIIELKSSTVEDRICEIKEIVNF